MHDKNSKEDRLLGLGSTITRRDFLNSSLLGSGMALLAASCPARAVTAQGKPDGETANEGFTGYGGVGDYRESNGNTHAVMQAAHRVRDGDYQRFPEQVEESGEMFDLIIVGGGLTGLMAAYEFAKQTGGSRRCLVIENHPVFGGEAKQNEFEVEGYRLVGPQGSNDFYPPDEGSNTQADHFFKDFHLPRKYVFQDWNSELKPLRFSYDNYVNMDGFGEAGVDIAYYFDRRSGAAKPTWIRNMWGNDLAGTPYDERVKADLRRWRMNAGHTGEEEPRLLDTMSYKHYLEVVKGYDPEVTRFSQPMVGLLGGVSSDAVSAHVGHGLVSQYSLNPRLTLSYPGGNTTQARHLVRGLIPAAISGEFTFEGVMNGRIDFAALDRAGQPTRIRLRSTATRVEHEHHANEKDTVSVTYENGGRLYQSRAKTVVMASGGWITKHVVADLPETIRIAYEEFQYAPALIVNVALNNWRFLYKLGAPAARWMDDGTMFGFCANIRRNMIVGDYNPPLHPDKPTLLTFYMGLYTPGHTAYQQGALGRMRLLSTSYMDYERTIRMQMTEMFGSQGFDAKRDIAGIVLNRWGHARVIQPPGFYYGVDGKPSPRDVVAKGFGRVIIAHAELNGTQNYRGAFEHGKRAAEEAIALG